MKSKHCKSAALRARRPEIIRAIVALELAGATQQQACAQIGEHMASVYRWKLRCGYPQHHIARSPARLQWMADVAADRISLDHLLQDAPRPGRPKRSAVHSSPVSPSTVSHQPSTSPP